MFTRYIVCVKIDFLGIVMRAIHLEVKIECCLFS